MNLRARRPCGGRVNRGGGLRAVAQGVFQAMRQQAMRGSRLRPPGLCLPPAHLRHRGTRANAGHRAPAGHAPMRTGGGRPGGAGGILRPFLGLAEILQIDPSPHKDHLFKDTCRLCRPFRAVLTVKYIGFYNQTAGWHWLGNRLPLANLLHSNYEFVHLCCIAMRASVSEQRTFVVCGA